MILIGVFQVGFSQVGINTNLPNAQLDIRSSNQLTPANNDGILIPRIDAFPVTNPTAAQIGMMVYLTTTSAGKSPGFYYWDATWKGFGNSAVAISNGTAVGNTMYWDGTSWVNTSNFLYNNGTSIGINTTTPSSIFTLKKDFIGFTQENTTGASRIGFYCNTGSAWLQTHSNTDLSFATNNGATQMTLQKATGNLGIGVANPTEKLEVSGKTRTTDLQVTNAPSFGKILTSDAVGNATWQNPGSIFGWGLIGNAGTNPATNFIGTTDDKDIFFKRNNILSGSITDGYTSFGVGALQNISGSFANAAFGEGALSSNISGSWNSAFGTSALKNNLGVVNSAFGAEALMMNLMGRDNTAAGYKALRENTNGEDNTAAGTEAMLNNKNSSKNVAVGTRALANQTFNNGGVAFDGNNVAIGYEALKLNNPTATTNGINNTALGNYALSSNSTGSNNTALGINTLLTNTTGSNNIAIGANANVAVLNNSNQLSIANVFYGANINDIDASYFSIGAVPINKYKLYDYSRQLTANGDGQYGLFDYRDRDSRNDGTSYSSAASNGAVGGRNYWGDSYTFGVAGHSDNDYNRSGGVLGSNTAGTYWSSLGYRNSAGAFYGVYATAVLATGAGRSSQPQSQTTIGGGFYGGLIGSWSKGNLIGSINSGSLFASYNSGDEYTYGKQIEIVTTGNTKTAAYTVTSTEVVVHKKGKVTLVNGSAHLAFDVNYVALLGDIPVVTTAPMGQCNGVYIESIDKSGFTIKELNNGSSNVTVSWIAVGDRVDAHSNVVSKAVLDPEFDNNINEVMFNENDKNGKAKGLWSESGNIHFGELPEQISENKKK